MGNGGLAAWPPPRRDRKIEAFKDEHDPLVPMRETRIGKIIHYWPRAGAAQVELEDHVLHLGDRIRVKGPQHDFEQTIESLEIDHHAKSEGWPGEHVAFAVDEPVHEKDEVYLLNDRA